MLPKAFSIIILPLFTRAMTPSEYGVLSILATLLSASAVVFTLGLDFSVYRGFFARQESPTDQRDYVASIWRFSACFALASSIVLIPISLPLVDLVSGLTHTEVVVALVASAVAVAAGAIPLPILRAQLRLREYLIITVLPAVASAVLSVIGVVVLDRGVAGWLVAYAASTVLSLIIARRVVPWRRVKVNWGEVKSALGLSLPMMPHFAAYWGLQLADRGLLAGLVSASALGIYSLGANVALPGMVAVQSLSQTFMPSYARAGKEPNYELRRTVSIHFVAVCVIALAIAALGPPAIKLLVDSDYYHAADVVGWIALGYAFLGIYSIPMNGAGLGANRSGFAWIASLAGVTVNLGAIYLLVPKYGIVAAAAASAAGYAVLFLGTFLWERAGDSPVIYPWGFMLVSAGVTLAAYFGVGLTATSHAFVNVLLASIWTAAAGLVCFALIRLADTDSLHGRWSLGRGS